MDYPAQRRQRLVSILEAEKIDALLITSPLNVTYLTGFSGESSYLVLGRDRARSSSATPASPSRSPRSAPAWRRTSARRPRTSTRRRPRSLDEARALQPSASRAATSPSPSWRCSASWRRRCRGSRLRDRVEQLAGDQGRVGGAGDPRGHRHRRAGLHRVPRPAAAGRHEKDLADALEALRPPGGRAATSFPTIVAVGERAALPHAPPTSRPWRSRSAAGGLGRQRARSTKAT